MATFTVEVSIRILQTCSLVHTEAVLSITWDLILTQLPLVAIATITDELIDLWVVAHAQVGAGI